MNYSDETADEMAQLQDEIDAAEPLGSRQPRSTWPWRRSAAPPTRPTWPRSRAAKSAEWPSASSSSKPPRCSSSTSPPTTSTPRPSPGSSSHLIDYKGTCLIVTHDRYFLDDITGWILELDRGRGIPYEGNYSAWLEQKGQAPRAGGPRGQGAPERRSRRNLRRGSASGMPGPPGQAEGPDQRL